MILRALLPITGTLRSDEGDVHENVVKNSIRIILSFFAIIPIRPVTRGRGFWQELKRGERAQVRREMVEFIALPFPFPSKLKIWSFHAVLVQPKAKKCTKKRDARAELLFCSLNLLFFDVPVAVVPSC